MLFDEVFWNIVSNDQLTKKQDSEKAVLFDALSARMSGRARQNLTDILGPKDGWKDSWRCGDFHRHPGCSNGPDLYRVFSDRIVGIEHFAVEKGVRYVAPKTGKQGKEGKYKNLGIQLKHDIREVRRRIATAISDDDMRAAGFDAHKIVWDDMFKESAIGDSNMWASLENSIGKHSRQIADYRANLRGLDGSKRIEVGLLVEISGDFSDLLLFAEGGIKPNKGGLLPLSDGLFERLFKALDDRSDDKFDFIVLYRRSPWFSDDVVEMVSVMMRPMNASGLRPYFQAEPVYYYIPSFLGREYIIETSHKPTAKGLDQIVEGSVRVYADWYWALVRRVFKWWSRDKTFCCDLELAAMAYALMRVGAEWRSFGIRTFENGAILEEAYPLVGDWEAVRWHMMEFARPYFGQGPLPLFLLVPADEYKKLASGVSERLRMGYTGGIG